VHPECKELAKGDEYSHEELVDMGEHPHKAACVKHDAFDVGYEFSDPIEIQATTGITGDIVTDAQGND
ncbi:MAG TPA: hypothetical protein VE134_05675, partial [Methanomicrobiales archaeon]|nr:hypothetical protein [Methanomicrobiales archaeon]